MKIQIPNIKSRKKHFRYYISRIGLSVISIIIILLVLEITVRVKKSHEDTKRLQELKNIEPDINNYEGKILLRHIIRLSSNPKTIYELIPNLSVLFYEKTLKTNSAGFRAPQYSKQKKTGTVRIVGLGDSFMFGWRVSTDECYLSLLEKKLRENFPDVAWEVINMAVPGYNTVMEVETLKAKGLQYNPDLVIIHFVGNDIDLPNFIKKKENYFSIKKSFLLNFISHRLQGKNIASKDPLSPAPFNNSEKRFENNPDQVPAEYKNMVGKDAYILAMKELKELSLQHNFQPLMLSLQAPEYAKKICSQTEIPTIETVHRINNIMKTQGIEHYMGSILTISKEDPHPSSFGHRIIADCIFEYLKKSGFIKKFTEKKGFKRQP